MFSVAHDITNLNEICTGFSAESQLLTKQRNSTVTYRLEMCICLNDYFDTILIRKSKTNT